MLGATDGARAAERDSSLLDTGPSLYEASPADIQGAVDLFTEASEVFGKL